MSFINSIGLLGLIGVPILILIYIIKSKYREYTIASTFIWELSEKFNTKKRKLSRFSGLLSLILQIFIVIVLSFALAHPIITIKDSAKKYVFVVDNSASMNIANRMDDAKSHMLDIIENAKNDSEFTIILAKEQAITLCEKQTNKEKVIGIINNISNSNLPCNVTNGIEIAQSYFEEDNSLNVYLFSDGRYAYNNNIEIINTEKESDTNAAINSLYHLKTEEGITFKGEVVYYSSSLDDKELSLNLYLDDILVSSDNMVLCKVNEEQIFTIETNVQQFEKAVVKIEIDDDLQKDNEYVIYGNSSVDSYNVLLVSDKPFYLQSILNTINSINLKVVGSSNYSVTTGYDLYIFDSYSPASLPEDGAVWLFNSTKNIPNSGFTSQGNVVFEEAKGLDINKSSDDATSLLTQNLLGNKVFIKSYESYGLIKTFTVLMSYNKHPMIFAGINPNGNRQIVFSFDLHNSNFPLLLDYIILMNNMIKYSLPQVCEQTEFDCGDELMLNVLANCEYIRINSPSNKSTMLSIDESTASYKLDELGTYIIETKINGIIRKYNIFVSFAKVEQMTINEFESLELVGDKKDTSYNSTYDIQWILLIALLVLGLLEWGVYIYEQH